MTSWIQPHWERFTAVSALLSPISLLFRVIAGARRAGYRAGLMSAFRLPVPVVVVGNITAGGTGKTPLTLWLAAFLRTQGRSPGIVCRGYGGTGGAPQRVWPDSDPDACGDEAVLLARRSGCPVWIGADRPAAARALLAAAPECDIVLSDDGLQHYALARDLEICVVDGDRAFGNGWLLPAGPLREPTSRLAEVDAVVVNGVDGQPAPLPAIRRLNAQCLGMKLEARGFWNLRHADRRVGVEHFRGRRVHAVAGIGNPGRFFRQLQGMGLAFTPHSFPDHHPFTASDLAYAGAGAVVMTEKDAVKCQRFAPETCWAMAVDAVPDAGLEELVLRKLDRFPRTEKR
jgi:tetraacyldisaccharide 4'-kinase